MYELGQEVTPSTDWLTTFATAVEKVGAGAKDIQSVLGKKKQAITTTGTGTIVEDTIMGMPSWLVYSVLGLIVVGGGAYFLLRTPSKK